mgnify:CR=1 FL=1
MAVMQIKGKSYRVLEHDSNSKVVEFVYNCPHCKQMTTVRKFAKASYDDVRCEGFFLDLKCNNCHEMTEVRYLKRNRAKESEDTV